MAKTKKPSHDWTPVREYVTTKNPDKVWTVEQNEAGELRCHCPGWIFRHRTGRVECKHIRHYRMNPNSGLGVGTVAEKTSWRDAFEAAVRAAFLARFAGTYASAAGTVRPTVVATTPLYEEHWRGFIDDLRLLTATTAPVEAPKSAGSGLGMRRVVLDDDE